MSTAIVLETERLRLREWDAHYGKLLESTATHLKCCATLRGGNLLLPSTRSSWLG